MDTFAHNPFGPRELGRTGRGERRARIFVQRDAEFTNRGRWPGYQAWLKAEVERMFRVLVPKAKELAG